MGVPAFFRWLSRKYAAIVVHCVEERPKEINGVSIPVDASKPNPNDTEFDNLYLDMNGIIHPCCHPEDKPAPKNEDEMMLLIFEYIDRIFSIVRPRKLLYMAIDGVAPRAKMNQQRSRRFRASKEASDKAEEISRLREEILSKGCHLPPEKPATEKFDSNCITPGTPFMFRLADCLRFYIHERLNTDPGWADIKVILSDANVPGEGEHKIMDYIRRQRAQPDHDPNTHHCLCGADADLIMLGLATHEPYFTIIREEFKPNQPRPCELCGQIGHEMKECAGLPKDQAEEKEIPTLMGSQTEFIFLRLNILREYLEKELRMDGLPFEYSFERSLDDWVFMCFFVGNDFLPHLPSLEIREGAIDRLVKLYKNTVYKTGGYLTDSGVVNLSRVQLVMSDLGEVEDEIFKKRRETELDFRRRDKEKKKRLKRQQTGGRPHWMSQGQYAPQAIGRNVNPIHNPRHTAYEMRMQQSAQYSANNSAAASLRAMISNGDQEKRGIKRRSEGDRGDDSEEEPEPADDVRLWEDGWKGRYYSSKFDIDDNDYEFRHIVANHYVIGLCWVLRYYYQGCASWKWYFPYHYAPFASDFVNIGDLPNDFEKNTEPFKPLEQLMGVFPAASKQHLPFTWQTLMESPESPIIDFYPVNFKIDLNGKKYAWQGVALLPFVDEKRLKSALKQVYPDLTEWERKRNVRGDDRLFVGNRHPAYELFEGLYEGACTQEPVQINPKLTQGMAGAVWCDEYAVLSGGVVRSPLEALKDLRENRAICVQYKDPQYSQNHLFPAKVLPGAKMPDRVLKPEDFEAMARSQNRGGGRGGFGGRGRGSWRPQLGFQRDSGYRDKDTSAALRMIRHGTGGGNSDQNFVMSSQSMYPAAWAYSGGRGGGGRNYQSEGGQQYGSHRGNQSRREYPGQSGNLGWQRNIDQQVQAYNQNMSRQWGSSYGGDRRGGSGYYQNQSQGGQYGQSSRGYGGRSGYGGSQGGRDSYSTSGQNYSQGRQDRFRPFPTAPSYHDQNYRRY